MATIREVRTRIAKALVAFNSLKKYLDKNINGKTKAESFSRP